MPPIPLHLRHFGHGPQSALLLHCGLGQSGMWKAMAENLSETLSMSAPDLPGHGRSPDWSGSRDVHDQATDAVRPLVQDGMHLIGHSFGATVALRLALETPQRIAALTLIEPVFFAAAADHPAHAPHRTAEEAFFAVFETGDTLKAARCFNRLWGGGVPWDRFPEHVQQDMARNMPFVAGTEPSLWQDIHAMLSPGKLEALQCPVCLLRGSETVPIIEGVHEGLLARLPAAREVVVPGAAHMVVMSHPQEVASAVLETDRLLRADAG